MQPAVHGDEPEADQPEAEQFEWAEEEDWPTIDEPLRAAQKQGEASKSTGVGSQDIGKSTGAERGTQVAPQCRQKPHHRPHTAKTRDQ